MAEEKKTPDFSEETAKTLSENEEVGTEAAVENAAPKKKSAKRLRAVAIVLAVIVGIFAALVLAAFIGGKILIEDLWGNTNYVSEPEYVTPSDWNPDEGIGPSTNLDDLINQLEKEEAEKNNAEQGS
jgi:hypothetical protein